MIGIGSPLDSAAAPPVSLEPPELSVDSLDDELLEPPPQAESAMAAISASAATRMAARPRLGTSFPKSFEKSRT
ncbi:MAG TPA: hypothetical protein VH268_05010 [Solirubrobacterales bacterium]|nr:hypothetical protein [Solirubrobacterales bacterium]